MNYRCSQKKQNPEVYYVKLFYHLQHLQLISVVSSDISHNILPGFYLLSINEQVRDFA